MNENINLVEQLRDCPKGTKLYSPLLGHCEFFSIYSNYIQVDSEIGLRTFQQDATISFGNLNSVEPMLFPSKDQRDWSKWKCPKPKFAPKTLKPFDKVLVRNLKCNKWECDFFSHDNICCSGRVRWDYCIPYNEETKHLVGTAEEAPEFYRYWEN